MHAVNQIVPRILTEPSIKYLQTVIRRDITVLLALTLLSFNYVAHNDDRKFEVADLVALE